jgi:hypothetical protein
MNRSTLDKIIESELDFYFLTAPIENSEHCVPEKLEWVEKTLGITSDKYPQFKGVLICPAKDKAEHARPDSVLIEDRQSTIEAWKTAGGQAFLFPEEINLFEKQIPFTVKQKAFLYTMLKGRK